MDQHGSHMDPDFTIKATASNIHPYAFPGHLTHVLQPLDVGVFQPYKHQHKKAVQHAMRNLDLDYNIASFMHDLSEIRAATFKKETIHSAFKKSGIWPISCTVAIKKMKIYCPPETPAPALAPTLEELPILLRTPKRFQEAEYGLVYWKEKMVDKFSSPSRKLFNSWACGTEKILAGGELTVLQHDALSTKVENQQKAKYKNCNVLQKHGVMTVEDAWAKKATNEAKRKAILEKKRQTLIQITQNKIKIQQKTKGVTARQQERERKKAVEALQKANQFVPIEMLQVIPDPELSITEADIDLQLREALISSVAVTATIPIDPELEVTLQSMEATRNPIVKCPIAAQEDYISFLGLDNGDMDWNYLDADEDADIGLF